MSRIEGVYLANTKRSSIEELSSDGVEVEDGLFVNSSILASRSEERGRGRGTGKEKRYRRIKSALPRVRRRDQPTWDQHLSYNLGHTP